MCAVRVTPAGQIGLRDTFGISLNDRSRAPQPTLGGLLVADPRQSLAGEASDDRGGLLHGVIKQDEVGETIPLASRLHLFDNVIC